MLVLTHGFEVRPFSTAFLARIPAAMSTDGFDVLVQLVMAAMTMLPLSTCCAAASSSGVLGITPASWRCFFFGAFVRAWYASLAALYEVLTPGTLTRSCGRAGPARLGSTEPRSSVTVSVYIASFEVSSTQSPCSFAYDSTRLSCASLRPVKRK